MIFRSRAACRSFIKKFLSEKENSSLNWCPLYCFESMSLGHIFFIQEVITGFSGNFCFLYQIPLESKIPLD